MAFASSNRVILRKFKETAWGEVPAARAMTAVQFTSETLSHSMDTVESNTIRSDRMRDALLEVGDGAEGDIAFELEYGNHDDMIAAAFMGAWTSDVLKNGVTPSSFAIERELADLTGGRKFIYYNGMMVNTMSLNIASRAIVTGSFVFMGKGGVSGTATVAASTAAAAAATPLTASANVGNILENGSALAAPIKSIALTLNNNLRAIDVIGTKTHAGLAMGTCDLGGTIDFYADGLTQYALFESHTPFALAFDLTDVDGNVLSFNLPNIYLTKATAGNAAGLNQEGMVTCDWKAIRDSATSAQIVLTRTPHA
jgi:hypothetical protein